VERYAVNMATDNSKLKSLISGLPTEPWPDKSVFPPEVPQGWFHIGNERILKAVLNKRTKLVVELGSWLGLSSHWILSLARNTHLLCIDHWKGSLEHQDKGYDLQTLFEHFQSNLWENRDRVHPLKMDTIEGLEFLKELGPDVDMVYVDASHDETSVTSDLDKVRQICPNAVICGDDFGAWEGVTQAVKKVEDRRLWVDTFAYRLDKIRARREKVITSVHYNRAPYTKMSLEYLAKCDGIEDYLLQIFMEPVSEGVASNDDVLLAIHDFDACEVELFINPRVYGCTNNTLQALKRGFELADFVIHLEDDILFSKDALKFFEFCNKRYKDESEVLTVGAYNQSQTDESLSEITRIEYFVPWGWATWKDRYEAWMKSLVLNTHSWDVCFSRSPPQTLCNILPVFSRAQNIGAHGGTHVPNPEWHAANQAVKCWAGEFPDLSVRNFWEGSKDEKLFKGFK